MAPQSELIGRKGALCRAPEAAQLIGIKGKRRPRAYQKAAMKGAGMRKRMNGDCFLRGAGRQGLRPAPARAGRI